MMKSFYIGPSGARIYCNLHTPRPGLVRDARVLLCPPLGHEYYRSYRAHVRLAEHLADGGFTVLRFDYQGTGDSDGDPGNADLLDHARDVTQAAAALRENEPHSPVVLLGMRFGSIVAALAAQMMEGPRSLVLWEPVLDGRNYVDGLRHLHRATLKNLERFSRSRNLEDSEDSEMVGHVYGEALIESLREFETARRVHGLGRIRVLVAESSDKLPDDLRETCQLETLPHQGYGWNDVKRVSETIVDPIANRQIAGLIDEVSA